MRLSLSCGCPAYIRLLWSVKLVCLLAATPALAQTELFGPERDAARKAIVAPVVFDPLLTMPLTPGPEGVVDVHGSDVAGTAHIAATNGDDSYGILASAPLSTVDPSTSVDPRGLRRHASLGFHLTNVIWHPKAKDGDIVAPWVLFIHADYRYNRAEYEFADPKTLERQTDTRLNDTASILFGAQLFSSSRRPGYFFGFSYTYSAVFEQFGGMASNGLPLEGPTKVRGNLLRIEMRHPFARRFGVNPSVTRDESSGVTTVAAAGYVRWRREYAGLQVGNSDVGGNGRPFATVFFGWSVQ